MCKWLRVVMAVVRFLLAVSSCLMSLVMSLTMASDSPALALMSRICGQIKLKHLAKKTIENPHEIPS